MGISDALGGEMPVLPNVRIPAALTEEKVLERVGGNKCNLKELGEVLRLAQKDAWEQAFATHADIIDGKPEVLHSAFAMYMKNEDFVKENKKLEQSHQQQLVRIFQLLQPSDAPAAKP